MLICRSCGNLISECSDPDTDWYPHKVRCYATATTQWGNRILGRLHGQVKSADDTLHPLEGVAVYAARVEPEGERRLAREDESLPS